MSLREEKTLDVWEDGVLVGQLTSSWPEVRRRRDKLLAEVDAWYLKDRWDALSSTAKGELNAYRAALRDVPATYETPAEAWLNMPDPPQWAVP